MHHPFANRHPETPSFCEGEVHYNEGFFANDPYFLDGPACGKEGDPAGLHKLWQHFNTALMS